MPIAARSTFALFLATRGGAVTAILRSSVISEPKLLILLGSGLLLLAGVVRAVWGPGGGTIPKSLQITVWVAPEEISEYLSTGQDS